MSAAPHGPFTVDYIFHFTNGKYDAEVSMSAPIGNIATKDDVATLAGKALAAVKDNDPSFRFMTRQEFVNAQLNEKAGISGMRFATPSGPFSEDWA